MKTWIAVVSTLALAFAGCGKKKEEAGGGAGTASGGSGAVTAPKGDVTLNASGSTFQKAFQEEAIAAFTKANSNVKINYGGGGSGKGRTDLADMVTDYAGSDSPYKDVDLAKNKGGEVLYFPVVLGAVTVSYNVPGLDKLQLSPETVAKSPASFTGKYLAPMLKKKPEQQR